MIPLNPCRLCGRRPQLDRFKPPASGWVYVVECSSRLILEYSERVEGKLSPRFSVQHPPDNPIQAGNSLNEAKQAIDHCPKSRIKGSR